MNAESKYHQGIALGFRSKSSWADTAIFAEREYTLAIEKAVRRKSHSEGMYAKGMMSDAKWKERALRVGSQTFKSALGIPVHEHRCEYCNQLSLPEQRRCDYCNGPL